MNSLFNFTFPINIPLVLNNEVIGRVTDINEASISCKLYSKKLSVIYEKQNDKEYVATAIKIINEEK